MIIKKGILFLHNTTGSRLYRVHPQVDRLVEMGIHAEYKDSKALGGITAEYIAENFDICVLQMVTHLKLIKKLKELKVKVVFDCDDKIESVPKSHPMYGKIDWKWGRDFYRTLHMVDAVITSNKQLANRYRWLNRKIYVFENYCDLEYWEKPYRPNNSDKLRLGWAGGNSHKEDLIFIAPVIKRILKEMSNVKFFYCGFGGTSSSNRLTEFNYGQDLFKDVPINQREFSLGSPPESWADKLNSLQFDVAVAPVVKNAFSKYKTSCKFLEYSINQVPGVYQKFLYEDKKNGENMILAETQEDFYRGIKKLLSEYDYRRFVGKNAFEYVKSNHNIDKHFHKWLNVIKEL